MTVSEQRAAIERELGKTIDRKTREQLLDALSLGPRSPAWPVALGIVGHRELERAQMTSPGRVNADEVWRRTIAKEVRRGRFVSVAAWVMLALIVATALFWVGYFLEGWP